MNIVGRLQIDSCLRQLRSLSDLSDIQQTEVRTRLISFGAAAVTPLFEMLRRPDVRPFTTDILTRLLNDETLPLYATALTSADSSIAGGAHDLLAASQHYDPSRLLERLRDPGFPKARLESVLSVQMGRLHPRLLVRMLPDLDKGSRTVAFRLLEAHADTETILEALPLASDPDWWMRLSIARLLAKAPAEPSVHAAILLLNDTNKTVRLEATRSLACLKAPAAMAPLCQALRDPDLRVQTGAIDALIASGDASAVPHLVAILKDESEQARRGAVEVLNEVITVEAVKDLALALRDVDWWVRARAADALGTLGGPKVVDAVIALIDDSDSFVRRYAVEILNTVPSERAVEPLIRALNDDDWWVRERAIDALARIGDPRAVEPLRDLLERDSEAKSLCLLALAKLGDERATRCLSDPAAPASRRGGSQLDSRPQSGAGDPEVGRYGVQPEKRVEAAPSLPAKGAEPVALPRRINYQDLSIGTTLSDRYRVMRKIGGGGFGTVYLVHDELVGEESILKILSPQLSHDGDMIRRFVQELRLTRRITHTSVIRIHEILDLGDTHAISMEYFPSHDLSRIFKSEGTLAPTRLVPMAVQVCEALQAAHDLGIVHRDVKPANILLGPREMVKVVDFGLAAVGMQLGSRLTRSGLLIGTPEYMSPEQIIGQTIDARSDLYSVGIVLYEALSGVRPYAGDSMVNVLFQHVEGGATPLSEVNSAIPEDLATLVMTAMAREPAERFSSAAEFRQQLLDLALPAQPEKDVA